ncbi:MAG: DUF4743 domain-containing protein [Rhodospirillales bacterium]
MSLLDRARVVYRWNPADYRPLFLDARRVGWVTHDLARRLGDFPKTILQSGERLTLNPAIAGFQARSKALAELHLELAASGHVRPPRGELYPLVRTWEELPALAVDRALVPALGLRSYGIHMNGFVRRPEGLFMWIGRRSATKATAPGKLDHLVGGGQPLGLTPEANLVKECAEEASIPEALARQARPVGLVSYLCRFTDGQRDDVLWCYDLEVPPDFLPKPGDDEVEDFRFWPIEQVMERVAESEDFKFNVALVIVDFLIRHGLVGPRTPGYEEILHCLRSGGD